MEDAENNGEGLYKGEMETLQAKISNIYFIVGKLSNLCNFDVVCRNATIVAIKLLIEAIYISNGTR